MRILVMGRSAATQTARVALQPLEEASRPDVFARENRQSGCNCQPPGAGQRYHRESRDEQRETTDDFRGSRDAPHCFVDADGCLLVPLPRDKQRHSVKVTAVISSCKITGFSEDPQ